MHKNLKYVALLCLSFCSNASFASIGEVNNSALQNGKIDNYNIIEGDIIKPIEKNYENENINSGSRVYRSAPTNSRNFWKNGIVYYKFRGDHNTVEQNHIRKSVEILQSSSGAKIQLIDATKLNIGNSNYILVIRGGGCYSQVGSVGRGQELSLAYGCMRQGTIIHEFVHALGMYHEQMRSDRDKYVKINWQNMDASKRGQFNLIRDGQGVSTTDFSEYDYDSIMHYEATAFSNNGRPTIEPIKAGVSIKRLVHKDNLSELDKKSLQKAYGAATPLPLKPDNKPKIKTNTNPYFQYDWTCSLIENANNDYSYLNLKSNEKLLSCKFGYRSEARPENEKNCILLNYYDPWGRNTYNPEKPMEMYSTQICSE